MDLLEFTFHYLSLLLFKTKFNPINLINVIPSKLHNRIVNPSVKLGIAIMVKRGKLFQLCFPNIFLNNKIKYNYLIKKYSVSNSNGC